MKAQLHYLHHDGQLSYDTPIWRTDRPVISVDNFSRHKTPEAVAAINAHDELVGALGDLVTWAADMGGWEATAWRRAEALLEELRKQKQP